MVRQPRRGLIGALGIGLLEGAAAGAAMVATTLALRAVLGIPLPVELASDRIVPTLSIQEFNRVVARFGGLVKGKEVAFFIGVGSQLILAALGGVVFVLALWFLQRRSGDAGRWSSPRSLALVVALPLLVLWGAGVALLWPVLASNYRGLSPTWASVASAGGLLIALTVYASVLVGAERWLRERPAAPAEGSTAASGGPTVARRALLIGGIGLVMGAIAGFLARSLYRRATFGAFGYDGLQTRGPRVDPVTPNDRFYVVTKNLIDPDIDRGLWRLQVQGAVEEPHTYDFNELAALRGITQPTTLECISNPVGGHLMSNAVWQGVPLASLLEAARPNKEGVLVVLHGADGYVHTIPLEKAFDPSTLVTFAMNGVPLPRRHGYPVRIIVPGAFGEVSVKWVDRIEVADHTVEGYYEKQGWKAQVVPTTSRIDRPAAGSAVPLGNDPIDVGGVAFAGDRGISLVQLSTDGGTTWAPATLDYAESPFSWALWSFSWRPVLAGSYRLVVRAADGTGALQSSTQHGPAPAGATGYHQVDVQIA